MFNLIITVIAIALVAAIAIATIYYGGSIWSQQETHAHTARILNEGAQIKGAVELYRNDHAGSNPTALDALTASNGHYLKSIPRGDWGFDGSYATSPVEAESNCRAVNEKLGYGYIVPTCADEAYLTRPVCCTTDGTPLN